MSYIVVYSSRTGNTKKIAEAIVSALPESTPCVPVSEAPESFAEYDGVFFGFWADQGNANKEAQAVIKRLNNKKVALFATFGVPPQMPHASQTMKAAADLLPDGQTPVGLFKCQGKVDPKVIELMYKMFPEGHPHGRNPEREARHKEAASHPDEQDVQQAIAFAREMLAAMEAN